jgi:hypothetical protein
MQFLELLKRVNFWGILIILEAVLGVKYIIFIS